MIEATEGARPSAPPRHQYPLLFWGAAASVLLLDQATKAAVRTALDRGESWPDWDFPFRLTHIINTGAAWGILEGQTGFLIAMALIGAGAIYLYYRYPPYNHWSASLGIGLLLGGALGNLIDRVRLGHVTDFFDPDNFPAFNIADSAINVGIFVLIVGWLVWGQSSDPADQQGLESRTENPEPGADAGTPADG